MTVRSSFRPRSRSVAGISAIVVASVALGGMAAAYDGEPTTETSLHDGSVWLTRTADLLVGHFNHESRLLDGSLRATGADFDIRQDGGNVLLVEDAAVARIDPAAVALGDPVAVPSGSQVELGADTVAVLDPAGGDLFVTVISSLGDLASAEPVAELGAGADMTVGLDGTVHAVTADGRGVDLAVGADGSITEQSERTIDAGEHPTITSVGGTVVVLDGDTDELVTADRRIALPQGDGAVLAADAEAGDTVTVATTTALLTVPLDGSAPSTVTADGALDGAPVEPVRAGECSYGAWGGSATFVRDCDAEADDLVTAVDGGGDDLRFRTNRGVVMLNGSVDGAAWLASDELQRVDNWQDVATADGSGSESDDDAAEEEPRAARPDRSDENTEPVAVDDELGVRAGRTTILAVLDNDTDPDGDVLTVSLPDGGPAIGEAQLVADGTAIQLVVPQGATGADAFRYEVDDGRGGTSAATVRIDVRPAGVNTEPEAFRSSVVTVEAGSSVVFDALADWRDDDGDPLAVTAVDAAPGDEADFAADGTVTYRALSGSTGSATATVSVSDGTTEVTGTIDLDIVPVDQSSPVAVADHVVVRPGQSAQVSPLANDVVSGSDPLRLTSVGAADGLAIALDDASGSFTVTAEDGAEGTSYVSYLVAAGTRTAQGVVRIDIVASADQPPVAVRDIALLPVGGSVTVPVLDNDSDPSGGVLVVQSATAPAGVTVAVEGHAILRISSGALLTGATTVSYRVSNGVGSSEGEVTVVPVASPAEAAPVASDDEAVVRAGDVVTIAVLDNDRTSDGSEPVLVPELVEAPDASTGEMFVAEDGVRFHAGETPGTVTATYEIEDAAGRRGAARVTVRVVALDAATNTAPHPQDVTARALSGGETTIPVELDGIDDEGDSVTLVGVDDPPAHGEIVETTASGIVYRADDDHAGLDTFTYRVRDALGAEAVATVRVGVAQPDAVNQPPSAVTDELVARPGREVAVDVLANDTDPEGGPLSLVADGIVAQDGTAARIDGDRVVVTASDSAGTASLQYTVRDEHGATATGLIIVTVDADAALVAPIARDDIVRAADVGADLTAEVAVLANDEDPDGTDAALTAQAEDGTLTADGVLHIELEAERRLIAYTVTDGDGLTARAFVHVPAIADLVPFVTDASPVLVDRGETVSIALSDRVGTSTGEAVAIADGADGASAHGTVAVTDATTVSYTAPDDWSGRDAVTIAVTAVPGGETTQQEASPRTATVSLPVVVQPAENTPPTIIGSSLQLGAGDDPSSIDLAGLAEDADGDPLEFSLGAVAGARIDALLDDGRLTASADADAAGSSATIDFTASDGVNPAVTAQIVVTVVASTKQLAVAVDDAVADAPAGRAVAVAVLDNDVNPFPETPLRLDSVVLESGDGLVEVSGDSVVVTPDADFVGTLVASYRIADATGDTARMVDGRVRVTVVGAPQEPSRPSVEAGNGTVSLTWQAPDDNGSPITEYRVSSEDGTVARTCPATRCTIDGLTNGRSYRFTVVAVNAVGASPPSAASIVARPDARPDAPAAPAVDGTDDGAVSVSWSAPQTTGSAVTSYTIQLSPAAPDGRTEVTDVTTTSYTWTGLENGVAYRLRVRAHSSAPEASDWSAWSPTGVPAASPSAPAAADVETAGADGGSVVLAASWSAPAANGATITAYEVRIIRDGSVVGTVQTAGTTVTTTVAASTSPYTVRVRARNAVGWSSWGQQSAALRAYTAPDAPASVQVAPGDRRIDVSWTEPAGNGLRPDELRYQYSLDGGSWSGDWADGGGAGATSGVITAGIDNGASHTVRIRAVGGTPAVTGAPSVDSAAVVPYGAVGTPSVSAQAQGDAVVYTWTAPPANGRDVRVQVRTGTGQGDMGAWQDVAASGTATDPVGYETTLRVEARAIDAAGQVSSSAAAAATTPAAPVARTVRGPWMQQADGCGFGGCAVLQLHVENFPAGDYELSCVSRGWTGEIVWGTTTRTVPENGDVVLPCGGAFPWTTTWVRIAGWGDAEAISWY